MVFIVLCSSHVRRRDSCLDTQFKTQSVPIQKSFTSLIHPTVTKGQKISLNVKYGQRDVLFIIIRKSGISTVSNLLLNTIPVGFIFRVRYYFTQHLERNKRMGLCFYWTNCTIILRRENLLRKLLQTPALNKCSEYISKRKIHFIKEKDIFLVPGVTTRLVPDIPDCIVSQRWVVTDGAGLQPQNFSVLS